MNVPISMYNDNEIMWGDAHTLSLVLTRYGLLTELTQAAEQTAAALACARQAMTAALLEPLARVLRSCWSHRRHITAEGGAQWPVGSRGAGAGG